MDIRDVSFKYLTYRNRTVSEMREHLAKKKFSEQEIDAEIESLQSMKYLGDIEFCKLYMSSSFARGRGMERIRRELRQKGVSRFDIEDAELEYEEENECDLKREERERAARAADRIMKGTEVDRRSLSRLGRRLASLGYSSSLIYDIIGKYQRE
ncbi:MAG: regulatory protein RecX [Anaerovoracaceae bacterium]|jgi:regulatory protein